MIMYLFVIIKQRRNGYLELSQEDYESNLNDIKVNDTIIRHVNQIIRNHTKRVQSNLGEGYISYDFENDDITGPGPRPVGGGGGGG